MPDIRFYHLMRRGLDEALPNLLEQSLARGWRVAVQTTSRQSRTRLDESLWAYRPESFLAHGTRADGAPETQPIYLTDEADNPNRADVRFFVEGARAAPVLADPALAPRERTVLIFAGDAEKDAAREQWSELLPLGQKLSYFKEDDARKFVLTAERNA